MPWIVTTSNETYTAGEVDFQEENTTFFRGGEVGDIPTPVVRMHAVIIHRTDGTRTPQQFVHLPGDDIYKMIWTRSLELEYNSGLWLVPCTSTCGEASS